MKTLKSLIVFVVASLVSTIAFSAEPPAPKKAPMFGLDGYVVQDCQGGFCPAPVRTIVSAPVRTVRNVVAPRRQQVCYGITCQVQTVQPQSQIVSVPVTEMVTEEIEVPVQKTVTVMERRTVQKPVTTYVEREVQVTPVSSYSYQLQPVNTYLVPTRYRQVNGFQCPQCGGFRQMNSGGLIRRAFRQLFFR